MNLPPYRRERVQGGGLVRGKEGPATMSSEEELEDLGLFSLLERQERRTDRSQRGQVALCNCRIQNEGLRSRTSWEPDAG